jgi:peptide-methionine (S)-S-oxide reductase
VRTIPDPEETAMRQALHALALLPFLALPAFAAEPAVKIDPPKAEAAETGLQTAVLAGGCFWGVQAVYQHVNGVKNAVSGYAGGTKEHATYEQVGTGRTGHAEAVQVTFDPAVISYGKILQIYFSVAHNPTQLDRQGPDTGPEYRSEIFPQTAAQRAIAKDYVEQLDAAKAFPQKIVTKINAQNVTFYPAEAYHQDYAVLHPYQPYIFVNDAPKVKNLQAMFPELYRDKPVTVKMAEAAGN